MRSATRVQLLDSVIETTYPPRMRLPEHTHGAAYLCFVKDGAFSERQGRSTETFDHSWSVFRPPNDEHANEFLDGGAVCLNVEISAYWLDRFRELGLGAHRFSIRSSFIAPLTGRLFDELSAADTASEVMIESITAEMMILASRRRVLSHGSRWMSKVERMIASDFSSPISLTSIADAVDVHPVHLARQFRATHGCSVGEYIREVRVTFARDRLAKTDVPIAEIALSAGFFDQSQLTKAFKRVIGQTPAAYRRLRR